MEQLKEMLLREQNRLENICEKTREQLENAPKGTLRLSQTGKWTQYYYCTSGEKKNGEYIPKENMALIHGLAQKCYDEKLLKLAKKRLSQIQRITKDYDEDEIEKVYLKEHTERRKLIHPIEPTWEQQLKEWMADEYQGKEFQEGTPVILTERGERVRSKSEKIMADYFYHQDIPYKYECPLSLKGIGIVYPDYTFLSPITRKEIYWEHNGRMDDPVYARKAIKKMEAYEKNGIYVGERLIVTFETSESILNTNVIETQVRRFLIAPLQ
ncbi:MAG: hypothetical protein ACI4DO_10345 [Roseburia sp.]